MRLALTNFEHFKTLHIAYSGGLDSAVLLHLLANSEYKEKLNVIHINHGLSPNAKQWEQHCQQQCEKLKLPLQIIKVAAKGLQGESPEAAARHARYSAFKGLVKENEVIVTAHHQDDQIETFFLQLFRGAGIKGLAAMPTSKTFAEGQLLRPLLGYSRNDLEAYAKQQNLSWIEDESNFDTNFQRNFLRHEVIPKLKATWPGMLQSVMRSVEHCQGANILLDDLAKIDYEHCIIKEGNTLDITELLSLSGNRRDNLMRYWIKSQGHPYPSQKKLFEIDKTVLAAKEDSNPLVSWENTEVRRYQKQLFIMKPLTPFDNNQMITWKDVTKPLLIPGLEISLQPELLKSFSNLEKSQVSICFRQQGQKVKVLNRPGSHDLKKLFQEYQVPPWLRSRYPLISVNGCVYFYAV